MVRHLSSAVVCVIATILCPVAGAGEPSESDQRFELSTTDTVPLKLGLPGSSGAPRCNLSHYRKADGDAFDGHCLGVSYSYLVQYFIGTAKLERNPWRADWVTYPPLQEGELMPLLGRVYRATTVPRFDKYIFEWVPKDKYPAGLEEPFVESLFVPIERHGVGGIGYKESKLRCVKIVPGNGGKTPKDGPSAELVYEDHTTKRKPGGSIQLHAGTVRVGDLVVIPNQGGFLVRRIVVPDAKKKILGWVEMSSNAQDEDDIAKTKVNVVRLQPPKK